jgi:lysophospholipase L1-like esterase
VIVPAHRPLRYVALGDSYTIGTAVEPADRWPDRLVAAVRDEGGRSRLELVANLAVNGYTSQDVIELELPALTALDPQFVSLLVGVNDVVQGVPSERYEANATTILEDLVARVGVARVLVVSTPDYTVTPQGAAYGEPARQAAGIRNVNAILHRLAMARGLAWVDVHHLSLRAADDPGLVADDGLHPSGAQYASWVARIAPAVEQMLALRPSGA